MKNSMNFLEFEKVALLSIICIVPIVISCAARKYVIADLHNCYLEHVVLDPNLTLHDPNSRISMQQIKAGEVKILSLPIFTVEGPESSKLGIKQSEIYKQLPAKYPELRIINNVDDILITIKDGKIGIISDLDNSTSFRSLGETYEDGIRNFEEIERNVGRLRSVTFSWHYDTLYGGGNRTNFGLKEDGKKFLQYLHQRNQKGYKTAIDLAHASEQLASDILNFIDKNSLDVPVMSSHTGCKAIFDFPRNLSDDILKRIISKNGIIGIYFLRPYVGENEPRNIAKHIVHVIKLGGENNVAFGADFFNAFANLPKGMTLSDPTKYFFPGYEDASKYPNVIKLLRKEGLSEQQIKKVAFDNYKRFLEKLWRN